MDEVPENAASVEFTNWPQFQSYILGLKDVFEQKAIQVQQKIKESLLPPESKVAGWPKWRNHLRTSVRYPRATKAGKVYAAYTTFFILLSISVMIASTVAQVKLDPVARQTMFVLQCICAVSFTIDLLIDFIVMPPHRILKEMRSFYFIIDFLSVLPFWIALIIGLIQHSGTTISSSNQFGWLMCLRVLRLLKLVELAGPNSRTALLMDAVNRSTYGFVALIVLYPMLVIFWGSIVYYMEFINSYVDEVTGTIYYNTGSVSGFQNIPVSMWFMIVTLTTTGYGDIIPQTIQGRFVTAIAMVCGVFLIAFPLTIVNVQYGEVIQEWKDRSDAREAALKAIDKGRTVFLWVESHSNMDLRDARVQKCLVTIRDATDTMSKFLRKEEEAMAQVRESEAGDDEKLVNDTKVDFTMTDVTDGIVLSTHKVSNTLNLKIMVEPGQEDFTTSAVSGLIRTAYPNLQFQFE